MAHSVSLSWIAPTSGSPVVSYDVQRAPIDAQGIVGAFVSIANPEPTTTSYVDNDPLLVDGSIFSYAVKSVTIGGIESVPSQAIRVVIPFPAPNPPTQLVGTPH